MGSRQPLVNGASMINECGCRQPPDGSRIWLPELVERFASFLHPNDVACNLRLVNRATAEQFRGRREFTTVRLSQPVPTHAFARRWGTPGAMRSLALKQRRELLRLTAASGSGPNLEVALAHAGLVPTIKNWSALFSAAAAAGHLNTYELLLSRQSFALDDRATKAVAGAAARAAAQAGQQAVCEVLLSRGAVCDMDTVCAAARGGHPDLLDWLLLRWPEGKSSAQDSRLPPLNPRDHWRLLEATAMGCSLQVLRDLHQLCVGEGGSEEQVPERVLFAIEAAAASPTPDWRAKVEWLETLLAQTLPPLHDPRFLAAASCPDALARLAWLRQRGFAASWSAAACQAAQSGNVAALDYLLDEGVELHHWLEKAAAEAGQLGVLTALHARGYPVDPGCVAFEACRGGHLPVVLWVVEALGAEVRGEDLLGAAAASGSVELMAWLRHHGASWSTFALVNVTGSGCEEAVEWAVAQGCPMPADGKPYVCAARNGDLATLRCLRRLGCPWGPDGRVFRRCVRCDVHLPVLQWLVQEGCVVDWQAALAVAEVGAGPGVRAWLEEQVHMRLGPAQGEGPVVPFRVQ